MKKTKRLQTIYHPLIKKIVFLSLFGFFLTITLSHYDNSFSQPTCSICKIKTSIIWTFSKIKVDSAPAIINLHLSSIAIFLCLSGIIRDGKTVFIDSQIAVTYPNKAPPFRS